MTSENGLSERELEILKLVATGASNKEIAQALVISPNTVKVHLRNIFAKTEASSRTEATLYAIRTGLIAPPVDVAPPSEMIFAPAVLEAEQPAVETRRRISPLAWAGIAVLFVLLLAGAFWGGQVLVNGQATAVATVSPVISVDRWASLSPLTSPRSEMAAARYEDAIYLIGGQTEQGLSDETLKLTVSSGAWSTGKNKPTAVKDAQAVLLGEEIYIPGGQTGDGSVISTLEVYNPRRDSWRTAQPLPVALSAYAAAAYEGRLFLFGGWDGSTFVKTVYVYDPVEDSWTERNSLSTPRGFAAAVSLEGKIQLLGGTDGTQALALNEYYYPQREDNQEPAWETRAPMPQKRMGMAAAVLANQVYVFGGQSAADDPQALPPVQYQPASDSWSEISPWPQDMGTALNLVPVDTQLRIFGGQLGGQPLAQHRSYQAIYNLLLPVIQDGGN
jgi:DNA-binding CsgD family transcriptional regulator/N-acetylneuraminic acid mutarotase